METKRSPNAYDFLKPMDNKKKDIVDSHAKLERCVQGTKVLKRINANATVIIPLAMLKKLGVGVDDLVDVTYKSGRIVITKHKEGV